MKVVLMEQAHRCGVTLEETRRIAEIPFDSDHKRMSVVHKDSATRTLYFKGVLESLLKVCAAGNPEN